MQPISDDEMAKFQELIAEKKRVGSTSLPQSNEVVSKGVNEGPKATKPGPKAKYPWDVWTDGNYHTLQQGKDFPQSTETFRVMCYNHARKVKLKVWTQGLGEDLVGVQFFKSSTEKLVEQARAKADGSTWWEEVPDPYDGEGPEPE